VKTVSPLQRSIAVSFIASYDHLQAAARLVMADWYGWQPVGTATSRLTEFGTQAARLSRSQKRKSVTTIACKANEKLC